MDSAPHENSKFTAPPPPSEVKIRTMHSDLASMAASGGGLPQFQTVKMEQSAGASGSGFSRKTLIIIILAVMLLVAIGWVLLKPFSPASSTGANTGGTATTGQNTGTSGHVSVPITALSPTSTTSTSTSPVAALQINHVSYFKKTADQIITISLPAAGAAASANDLQTYNQHLVAALGAVGKTASMIDIDVKDASGHDLGINDLLAQQNATIIDPATLAAHFMPDATFFAFRDKNGFWPGYILKLNLGDNWLSVQGGFQKLESSIAIPNMFLVPSGSASSGFIDGTLAGTPVRMLALSGGSVPASFVYGWTANHQYLILSTSQAGFSSAVARL